MPASGGILCRMSNKPDSLLKPREMFKTFTLTGLAALLAATALTVATPVCTGTRYTRFTSIRSSEAMPLLQRMSLELAAYCSQC